jgi:short-subunit dehydrogenase
MNVLPGFTRTEFQSHGNFGQHFIPGPVWMTAEQVVRKSLKALDRGRSEVVPGFQYRMVALVTRLSPWPLTRLVLRGATRKMW